MGGDGREARGSHAGLPDVDHHGETMPRPGFPLALRGGIAEWGLSCPLSYGRGVRRRPLYAVVEQPHVGIQERVHGEFAKVAQYGTVGNIHGDCAGRLRSGIANDATRGC